MRKFLFVAALAAGLALFGFSGKAQAGGCGPYYGGYGGGYYGGGYGGAVFYSPGFSIGYGYDRPYGFYGRPWRGRRYYRGYYRDRFYGPRGYYGRYRWRY